jgi:hypothetical protein
MSGGEISSSQKNSRHYSKNCAVNICCFSFFCTCFHILFTEPYRGHKSTTTVDEPGQVVHRVCYISARDYSQFTVNRKLLIYCCISDIGFTNVVLSERIKKLSNSVLFIHPSAFKGPSACHKVLSSLNIRIPSVSYYDTLKQAAI